MSEARNLEQEDAAQAAADAALQASDDPLGRMARAVLGGASFGEAAKAECARAAEGGSE